MYGLKRLYVLAYNLLPFFFTSMCLIPSKLQGTNFQKKFKQWLGSIASWQNDVAQAQAPGPFWENGWSSFTVKVFWGLSSQSSSLVCKAHTLKHKCCWWFLKVAFCLQARCSSILAPLWDKAEENLSFCLSPTPRHHTHTQHIPTPNNRQSWFGCLCISNLYRFLQHPAWMGFYLPSQSSEEKKKGKRTFNKIPCHIQSLVNFLFWWWQWSIPDGLACAMDAPLPQEAGLMGGGCL